MTNAKELQDRYDAAARELEGNCMYFGFFPNPDAVRRRNGELQKEIAEIKEEANQQGVILLSPKRLL